MPAHALQTLHTRQSQFITRYPRFVASRSKCKVWLPRVPFIDTEDLSSDTRSPT
jgi:hypothetical protein